MRAYCSSVISILAVYHLVLTRPSTKGDPCVASSTSGQKASGEMRDFDLLQAACRGSEVNEQTRASTIYGGAEIRDFARGGSTWCAGERGMPAPRFVALGILS